MSDHTHDSHDDLVPTPRAPRRKKKADASPNVVTSAPITLAEPTRDLRKGEAYMPISVFDPLDGGMKQKMVAVVPEELRVQVEGARRAGHDLSQRIAARIGDAPARPDREMLRAHLASGYLDVWFEGYARWITQMNAEFIGNVVER